MIVAGSGDRAAGAARGVGVLVDHPDGGQPVGGIPGLDAAVALREEFSTIGPVEDHDRVLEHNGFFHRIENLAPGTYEFAATAVNLGVVIRAL